MKLISYKEEMGDTERICTREPHRVLLGFTGFPVSFIQQVDRLSDIPDGLDKPMMCGRYNELTDPHNKDVFMLEKKVG